MSKFKPKTDFFKFLEATQPKKKKSSSPRCKPIRVKLIKRRKKTRADLEQEIESLKKRLETRETEQERRYKAAEDYHFGYNGPAKAVRKDNDPNSDYICSRCSAVAFYDGRCGDGPILMCGH